MMKAIFAIIVFAIFATAKSQSRCMPGSVFQHYCNTCWCSADGESAKCTTVECESGIWNMDGSLKFELAALKTIHQVCQPFESFKDYCNTCRCSLDGRSAVCTSMFCDLLLWNKDGTLRFSIDDGTEGTALRQMCTPGDLFKDYCNTCICSRDGKAKTCTLMDCDLSLWNEDGTLKSNRGPVPVRKILRKNEPNKDESLQSSFIDIPDFQITDVTCVPGTVFVDGCNTCICAKDGLKKSSRFCTKIGC